MIQKNKFIQLWLIIGIIAGFAAVLFFVIAYLNNEVFCDLDCRVRNEATIAVIGMSLFGMFVGSLTYYFISEKYEKEIGKIHRDISSTYRFLEPGQRKIFESIIRHMGETTQSKLVKDTGLSRVRVSRHLKHMEGRGIIKRSKEGMTNKVVLPKDIKDVFR